MSINEAGKIFLVSALDGTVGVLTGTLIESVCPPIRDQGSLRLAVEALLQLGTLTFVGIEVAKVINRAGDDPTNGIPYTWGLFVGNPNTMAKLGLLGQQLRLYISSIISQPQGTEVDVPAQ